MTPSNILLMWMLPWPHTLPTGSPPPSQLSLLCSSTALGWVTEKPLLQTREKASWITKQLFSGGKNTFFVPLCGIRKICVEVKLWKPQESNCAFSLSFFFFFWCCWTCEFWGGLIKVLKFFDTNTRIFPLDLQSFCPPLFLGGRFYSAIKQLNHMLVHKYWQIFRFTASFTQPIGQTA